MDASKQIINKKVLRRIISILLVLFMMHSVGRFAGISLKKASKGSFIAVSIPAYMPDFYRGNHYVDIYVLKILQPFTWTEIHSSWYRGFKGMYWEEDEARLWIDDESGLSVYEYKNNIWVDYSAYINAEGEMEMIHKEANKEYQLEQYNMPLEVK